MQGTDATSAGAFLAGVFALAGGPVYISSLPNTPEDRDAGEPGEKHLMTRDAAAVAGFVNRWDRTRRGLFFCVSTLRQGATRRSKEDVAELPLLHADVDFKSIVGGEVEVLAAIEMLPVKPAIVVRSGNGLHLYWLLKEALVLDADGIAQAELALRQLADVVGGDLGVAEVSRLMRLPGTHNTKGGAQTPVQLLRANYDAPCLLEEIEDMLAYMSPLVKRRESAERAPAATNPFLAAASRLGFKPPIDVQARLEAMSYQGAGEAAIHQTQISVSAALLNRGSPVEDVVSSVLDATRAAAGEFGERWNWVREERAVRRMCEDWVRKNPRAERAPRVMLSDQSGTPKVEQEQQSKGDALASAGGAVVHRLSDHRKSPPKPRKASDKAPPAHVVLAAAMIEGSAAEGRPFLSVAEASGDRQLWRYADGIWSMASSIDVEIEVAARLLGIPTSIKLRSETLAAIKADPAVVRQRADVLWDGHGMIPARNGLVDIQSFGILPYEPGRYATWRLPFAFDAAAECPAWVAALRAFFRDKEPDEIAGFVALLQEWAGAALLATRSRAMSRALVLYGPHNAGKSQILNVLVGLFGKTPIAQPLSSLEGEHGTVPFTRHAPWVLHEAFNQGRWVLSDKIKQLITGEPIQINIKRGLQFEHVFRAPILWATNHPPSIRDASRAVASRMLVVPCNAAFDDREPTGVAAEAIARGFVSLSEMILETEGAGVLRWAIEGLRRLLARGRFLEPSAMAAVAQEIHDDANPVAEFLRDHCTFDPDRMVRVTDFMAAYAVWFGAERGEDLKVPSAITVGRAVTALGDHRIGTDKLTFRTDDDRFYGGLVLSRSGLSYWRGAEHSATARGRAVRLSTVESDVNRSIPGSWDDRREVVKMRRAHAPPGDDPPPDKSADRSNDRYGDAVGGHLSSVIPKPLF